MFTPSHLLRGLFVAACGVLVPLVLSGQPSVPFSVEIESASHASSYWSVANDPVASGTQGLQAAVSSTSAAPAAGGLVYGFTLSSPSTIYLHLRAKAANTSSDSVWVRLNGGTWAQFSLDATGAFTWRNRSYSSVPAGNHQVEIRVREAGAWLDALGVTTSTTPPALPAALAELVPVGAYFSTPWGTAGDNGPGRLYDGATADGGNGTRWASNTSPSTLAVAPREVVLDLGASRAPSRFELWPYQARAYHHKIYVSDNPSSWGTPVVNAQPLTGQSSYVHLTPGAKSGRYVRLVIDGISGGTTTWASVNEFRLLGDAGSAPPTSYNLDPAVNPSKNFDLTKWKYTKPDGNDVQVSTIIAGAGYVLAQRFYTDPVTGGMVFRCGNKEGTTSGSSYTRSELRGMLSGTASTSASSAVNNWYLSGSSSIPANAGGVNGTLKATLAVDRVSTTGTTAQVGRVIVGQIHASDNEPCRLYYHKRPSDARGAVYFAHEYENSSGAKVTDWIPLIGSNTSLNPADGIVLGEIWAYEIRLINRALTVTIRRPGKPDVVGTHTIHSSFQNRYMYFKAGVYNQNNSGDADANADYVQATFYELTATHP